MRAARASDAVATLWQGVGVSVPSNSRMLVRTHTRVAVTAGFMTARYLRADLGKLLLDNLF